MKLTLESESIGRTGGITGAGARKVIGAPHIDALEVVIREAMQNSWDAREDKCIQFGVEALQFDNARQAGFLEALSDGLCGQSPLLQHRPCDALLLYDTGTTGLDGTLQADCPEDGKSNFVSFVYMIGDTKEQTQARSMGGTYGFGRSSFIAASSVGTILVYSVCKYREELQARFVGMTWTDEHRCVSHRRTGRHWWGQKDGAYAAPVTGVEARSVAQTLGMDRLKDAQGTVVLILNPRWPDTVEEQPPHKTALSRIRAAILWNCWPHLLDGTIKTSINWFGKSVELGDPSTDTRLRYFTQAWGLLKRGDVPLGSHREMLTCGRPKADLGTLVLAKGAFNPSDRLDDGGDSPPDYMDPTKELHHIALMRGTGLVIQYAEGPLPQERTQYAGVFLANGELDAIYAESEPVAHNEWVPERVTGEKRTLVRVTYRRIRESIDGYLCRAAGGADGDAGTQDLGPLADQLGALFLGVEGDGGGGSGGGGGDGGGEGGGGGRGGSGRVNMQVMPAVRTLRGETIELVVPVVLRTSNQRLARVTLKATASVVVDGGAEREAPINAPQPKIVGWQRGRDAERVDEPSVLVTVDSKLECLLTVRQPQECSIKLVIETE